MRALLGAVSVMQFLPIRPVLALLSAVSLVPAIIRQASARRVHQRPVHRHRARLPADYPAWSRVAGCESGGWQVLGAAYPDSLGISRANYVSFGGTPLDPGSVSRAEQVSQIQVADRLIAHYHTVIPDQDGCGAW